MRGKPWSEEETQTLLKMYEEEASPQDAAVVLGRDVKRIYEKCRRLGISMRHKREWSTKELAKLHEMYRAGKSIDDISAEIGRTSCAVKAKARTEGLLATRPGSRVCKRWSKADEKRLKYLIYETCSIEETARKLGRTTKSVRGRMSLLNISLRDAIKRQVRGS